MLRSKREEQKKDVYIQSRVQKKIRCKSIQSSEKRKQDTQQFQTIKKARSMNISKYCRIKKIIKVKNI